MTATPNPDQEQAVRPGLGAIRQELLDGHHDALAAVEIEQRLEVEAARGFRRAVAEARAEGFSWDRIAHHAGFVRSGVDAGEKLFEAVAVRGGHLDDFYLSWHCGDCESLVLDYGPYCEHPVDAESGHRQDCARFDAEISRYVAGRDREDELAAGLAGVITDHVRELGRGDRSIELHGPGLDLW